MTDTAKKPSTKAAAPPSGTPTETRTVQWPVKLADTDIALDAPATTAVVGSVLKIDSEYMTVSSVANKDNLAVARGTYGSTASTHETGASVAVYAPPVAGEAPAPGADEPVGQYGGGTTAEFTASDIVLNEQAAAAGQPLPKPDVPMPDTPEGEAAAALAAGAPAPPPAKHGTTQPGDLGLKVGGPNDRVHRPEPLDRSKMKRLTPEGVADKYPGDTIKLNFPSPVNLTLDNTTLAQYPAGHFDVPESVAEKHAEVLKNSGVTKVEDAPYKEPPPTLHGNAEKTAPRKKD